MIEKSLMIWFYYLEILRISVLRRGSETGRRSSLRLAFYGSVYEKAEPEILYFNFIGISKKIYESSIRECLKTQLKRPHWLKQ